MTLAEVIDTLQTWIRNADDEYDREEMGRVAGLKEALHEIKKIEPCNDCISRQAVLDKMKERDEELSSICPKDIKELPPVQPKPKTGHWIKTPKAVMGEGYMWYCDNCEHQVYQDSSKPYPSEKYCPECGAKMFEPQKSEVEE